ncbi:hypothetical protein D9E74_006360 [Escherichia coli]|nr:hypothetical protein [Escherichia coli]
MRDLILQLSKSSIYSTKPIFIFRLRFLVYFLIYDRDLTFVAQLYLLHFSLRGITQFHHSILFCERAHTCELSQ